MADVSIDELWADLTRLLDVYQMTLDEFQERGEDDELGDIPVLEYAYKAVWPVLKETTTVG